MEVIAWEKLADYIVKQLPAVIPIAGRHKLSLAIGKDARTLSLRIPYAGGIGGLTSPYREVAYELAVVDGKPVLELITSSPELFHGFYLFSVLVIEHIEERGDDVLNAVRRAQHVLGQLLIKRALLSEDREVGLIGELCLLQAILRGWGKAGISAWVGPAGERHDFRFGDAEIEVKTTTSSARKHRVNGADQLEPSPGRVLYLLSIQMELAGLRAGHTLPERIAATRNLLSDDVHLVDTYDSYLRGLGYEGSNAALYTQRYQLRSRPTLVLVDRNCPKITRAELKVGLAESLLARIGRIEYEVDVSGLGYSEGSERYGEVLKNIGRFE